MLYMQIQTNAIYNVGIKSDNSTAVSNINNMGGMPSEPLDQLACKFWLWWLERDIYICSAYSRRH